MGMGQDSSHVVAACGKASLKDSFVMFCFHRRSRSTRHEMGAIFILAIVLPDLSKMKGEDEFLLLHFLEIF